MQSLQVKEIYFPYVFASNFPYVGGSVEEDTEFIVDDAAAGTVTTVEEDVNRDMD